MSHINTCCLVTPLWRERINHPPAFGDMSSFHTCTERVWTIHYSHNEAFWEHRAGSQESLKCIERAKRSEFGFLLWLVGGTGKRVLEGEPGAAWCDLPPGTQEGKAWAFHHLPHTWTGEETGVRLESCEQSDSLLWKNYEYFWITLLYTWN